MHGQRLFWRLFLSYVIIALSVLMLGGWYGRAVLRSLYFHQVDASLEARARLMIREAKPLIEAGDYEAVNRLCREQADAVNEGQSVRTRITIILPSGKVVGESGKDLAGMDDHSRRPEIVKAFLGEVGRSTRPSDTIGSDLRYVAVPFAVGDSTYAVARSSIPVTELDRTLRSVFRSLLLNGLFAAVLVGAASLWLGRRISRPLEDIERGARRLAQGELDHRVQGAGIAEIDSLADALNRMASQWADRVRMILRQQNEQEAMLSSMTEGVLAVDDHGTVITMNSSGARILGADIEKLRGRTVHEVVRKPDLLRFIENALSESAPLEGEIELIDDETRILHAHATTLIGGDGRPIGALIMLRDVTRLRRLEEVRRDFVANVSHELRTPITSIKGFVETLLDGAIDDRDSARRFLEIIQRQANRLDAIIEDLLVLSRLERGQEEAPAPQFPTGDVAKMLRAAVEICQKQAEDRQIRIECQCQTDLFAPMNAHLLEQAVVNLLDNAIKYSDAGKLVRIEATTDGAELFIRVKDEGCGIERRHLPRLFERFYRVDKARSRKLGGTGLGLAIVKHIVRAHGGTVDVESIVGRGSTFTIRLPSPN